MKSAIQAKLPGQLKPCPSPEEILTMIKDHCGNRAQIMNFSSFSPSLYDTAWLSMVPTEADQHTRLFPQCLDIILKTQQTNGTWPSYASPTDGILVSLAALLSIATHRATSPSSSDEHPAWTECIERGVRGLKKLLQSWDVGKAVHVGFELLITSLMRQLDGLAVHVDFPALPELMRIYLEKMKKISPELLYGSKQTTLLHSAEAFVGVIDYGRISHHCSDELGIFGSPAATAAYLMHSSQWDQRAERYLRKVVMAYGDNGEVPSAFPTPVFEMSWAISSMLSPIIEGSFSGGVDLSPVKSLFQGILDQQGSLVGFAPGILEDADDTARALLMLLRLRRLGHEVTANVAPLISKFEAVDCFKTYQLERNASFSANCNVVLALLEAEDQPDCLYDSQIEKALTSLLDIVEIGARDITDKWNLSSEYSTMLLFEVMIAALKQHDADRLQTVPHHIFTNRIPKTLCRLISQLLAAQKNDGSWGRSLEVTSYSILGLSHVLRVPWSPSIRAYLEGQIAKAKSFIDAEYAITKEEDYLWIEKTTFQLSFLRMAYCSMALHTKVMTEKWSKSMIETFTYISNQTAGMKRLFSSLPLLKNVPEPLVDLILVEAKYHTSDLATGTHSILPQSDSSSRKAKYLGYIPVIWLLSNQMNNQALSTNIIGEMLRLSQLTYQIDEFMETTVATLSVEDTRALETWIQSECSSTRGVEHQNGSAHCDTSLNGSNVSHVKTNRNANLLSISQNTLRKFMQYILRHQAVMSSPPLIQHHLANDLSDYLLAHMRQNNDNAMLKSCKYDGTQGGPCTMPSYFSWARGTGAIHTSCPMASRFFMCLISTMDRNFESVQAQHLSSSVAQHLATMCRQYNDYGSIVRDAEENNLNSVNFAEFQPDTWVHDRMKGRSSGEGVAGGGSLANGKLRSAKQDLMAIAEFERKLMESSFAALKELSTSPGAMDDLRVLVDVTDLFGQLYVARDVSTRKRASANAVEKQEKIE